MHTVARRWTARSALTGLVLAGVATAGLASPASAFDLEGDCSPASVAGTGRAGNQAPVATDDSAQVINGLSVAIPVLANDSDPDGDTISIVRSGAGEHGDTCVDGSTIYYTMYDTTTAASDSFTYAITDGDYYRTATVTVDIEQVDSDLPRVVKKLRVSHGKVARKAQVSVTNPSPYTFYFYAGDFSKEDAQVVKELAPGQTKTFLSSRRALDYVFFVVDPNDEESGAVVSAGRINNFTGVVRETSSPFERTAAAKAATRWNAR